MNLSLKVTEHELEVKMTEHVKGSRDAYVQGHPTGH